MASGGGLPGAAQRDVVSAIGLRCARFFSFVAITFFRVREPVNTTVNSVRIKLRDAVELLREMISCYHLLVASYHSILRRSWFLASLSITSVMRLGNPNCSQCLLSYQVRRK